MNPETVQQSTPASSSDNTSVLPEKTVTSGPQATIVSAPKSGNGKIIFIILIILLVLGVAAFFTLTEQGKNLFRSFMPGGQPISDTAPVSQSSPTAPLETTNDTSNAQLDKDIQVLNLNATGLDTDMNNVEKGLNDIPIDSGQ